MKFNINGQEYRVRFSYSDGNHTGGLALQNVHNKHITTTAVIQAKTGDTWPTLTQGSCKRNPIDPFSKSKGRKAALQRAIQKIPVGLISKEDRVKIWDAYFKQHNDPTPREFAHSKLNGTPTKFSIQEPVAPEVKLGFVNFFKNILSR